MAFSKYTIEDAKRTIKNKNGTLLSSKYKNTRTKLFIVCNECDYKWTTNYKRILSKKWCPKCAGKARYSYSDIRKEVEERNGILLSKSFVKMLSPLLVRCNECDYEWTTNPPRWRKGHWCPNCAGNSPIKYCDIVKYILKMNGILLTTEKKYLSGNKIKISCGECGKIWKQLFNVIRSQDTWCPRCRCNSNKEETKLFNVLKEIFTDKHYIIKDGYNEFPWLYSKKTKGKQHIDFIICRKNGPIVCGIERNGEQHYRPVCFGGMSIEKAEDQFKKTLRRDRRKRYLVNKNKNIIPKFIIFNYKHKITVEKVKLTLLKHGVTW